MFFLYFCRNQEDRYSDRSYKLSRARLDFFKPFQEEDDSDARQSFFLQCFKIFLFFHDITHKQTRRSADIECNLPDRSDFRNRNFRTFQNTHVFRTVFFIFSCLSVLIYKKIVEKITPAKAELETVAIIDRIFINLSGFLFRYLISRHFV